MKVKVLRIMRSWKWYRIFKSNVRDCGHWFI